MSDQRYHIDRTAKRITAQLVGDWDEAIAKEYATALANAIDNAVTPIELLVDMRRMTGCRILARGALADVHNTLRKRLRRSVYVADRPRFRGVALWVVHVSEDPAAKVVRDIQAAEEWFVSDRGRVADAQQRLSDLSRRSSDA